MDQVRAKVRNCKMWQACRNPAETRANCFHRQLEQDHGCGAEQEGDNCARDAVRQHAAQNYYRNGSRSQRRCCVGNSMKVAREGLYALPEDSGDFSELQAEEIFYLRAGDQDGMPLVNPITTGRGMNLTAVPRPAMP